MSDITLMASFRSSDRLGIQRSLQPTGVLPQQAERVDPALPIARDEMLIEVESLNIDSASFRQIKEVCAADEMRMEAHIRALVATRGKHHNPVTGSGGMLLGRVAELGPDFPIAEKPVSVGDRIATLVSLSLTPLHLRAIRKIHVGTDRVDVEGHAILFSSGLFARLPRDLPESVSLAVLDVAGAPAQMRQWIKAGQTVLVLGGAGKSGMLCLAEARRTAALQGGGVRLIAADYSAEGLDRVRRLGLADECIQGDARDAVGLYRQVAALTGGKMADFVVNVTNLAETEMAAILSCRQKGTVYFFSMATSFTRATLGAEGVGADVDLRMGNGYTEGHAELALDLVKSHAGLRDHFLATYR
jgi:L-erythro-3,5-diaminohexanoate dehydrogenase